MIDLGLPDGYGGDLIKELRAVNRDAQALALSGSLDRADIAVHTAGPSLSAHGTTTDIVSQIAFDNRIRIVEISETSRSLEEILLDMTAATALFASA